MKKCDFDEVLKFIKSTFGKDKVPLHEPKFIGNEKKYLLECIDSLSQVSANLSMSLRAS